MSSQWTFRRPTARAVLLDPQDRIFLMQAYDPMRPEKGDWWEIPGGGMSAGETSGETARRELYEEAGFTEVEVGPCIWTQEVEFDFAMYHFHSFDSIHLCRVQEAGDWKPAALEALEAAAFEDGRWWALDELLATDVAVLPERLREFLPAIVAGDIPPAPIDISPLAPSGG